MLLDVASEQANRELLLQKHFYALISCVWKAAHVDRRQNLHATCNGLYFDQSFFSSIGQHSQNPRNKPSERMTFANSAQSKMLLAAALDDLGSRPENDKIVLSNQGKNMPVTEDQADITLEFPKEESDSLSSFPSVIKLSIKLAEAPPSINKHTRNDHLKSNFSTVENRFRYG
jgi:E1A-binding protein p400